MNNTSLHYWKIHKKVALYQFGNLSEYVKGVVASDTAGISWEAREFHRRTHTEAERLFNDWDYYYNNPDSFKYADLIG